MGEKGQKTKVEETPGVVYLGHIPHGFYEKEMRSYFTQFGNVLRLRLSRNKKTGQSKHFAFIEFESEAVAQIVADTMDGYLLFSHILTCKVVPKERLHPDTFAGADRTFKKIPWNKIQRVKHNSPKNAEQKRKHLHNVQKADGRRRKKLAEMGIAYDFPKPSQNKSKSE